LDTILFLDDDEDRHRAFKSRIRSLGYLSKYQMIYAYNARFAIEMLEKHEGVIVQAFLDHDLSEEDQMSKVGAVTKVPTGMTVVDRIVNMSEPPANIIVHSLNPDAAEEMVKRLVETRRISVSWVPFTVLLTRLR